MGVDTTRRNYYMFSDLTNQKGSYINSINHNNNKSHISDHSNYNQNTPSV